MKYSSRTFLISWGLGSLSRVRSARSSSSSRMMSLHSSTHSSQIKTEGPAINFRTSCWLFPQKEQYSSLPSPRPFCLSAIEFTSCISLVYHLYTSLDADNESDFNGGRGLFFD